MNLINADIKPGMMCQDTIINNRLDISICLDTGASASCIREEVYRKLKIGKPLTHAKIKVTGIGESSIRNRPISLGKVRLKLQFKGRKGILEHEFIVLRNLIPPILIGNDFLRKFKATIDCGSNKLTYQLLNSKEVLETDLRTVRNYASEEGEVIYLTDHTAFLVDMEEDNSHKVRESPKLKRTKEENSQKGRESSKPKKKKEDNPQKEVESSKQERMEEDNSYKAGESSKLKRTKEENSQKGRESSKPEREKEDNPQEEIQSSKQKRMEMDDSHKTRKSSGRESREENNLHRIEDPCKTEEMEEDKYKKTEGSSETENIGEDYSRKTRPSKKENKGKSYLQKGKGSSKKRGRRSKYGRKSNKTKHQYKGENKEAKRRSFSEEKMEVNMEKEEAKENVELMEEDSEEEESFKEEKEKEDSDSAMEDDINMAQTENTENESSDTEMEASNVESRSSDTEMESPDTECRNSNTETYTGRYGCNECQELPIKGDRFHCNTCDDYDLCHKCHTEGVHDQHAKTRMPMTVKEYAVILTDNLEIPGKVDYHITCNSEDTWDFKIAKLKVFGFKPEQIQMRAIIEDENKPGHVIISIKNTARQTAIIPVGAKLGTTHGIDNLKVVEDCKNCVELVELTEVSIMEIEENQSEVCPDYSCNAPSVSWYYSD